MKKSIIYTAAILSALTFSSCRDQFSDLNTTPEKTEGKVPFLFTQALREMEVNEYGPWWFNNRTAQLWMQFTAEKEGNTTDVSKMTQSTEAFSLMINVKREMESLKAVKKDLSSDQALAYEYIEALGNPIQIYLGMLGSDVHGSIPYSQAAKAHVTEAAEDYRPKYDTQAELFDTWLDELKYTVETLSNDVKDADGVKVAQYKLGAQDFVYKGDYNKWLKFANSLRLKIAVRLLHQDKARAFEIAKDVMKYPIIETSADDFIWAPGVYYYGGNNDNHLGEAAKNFVDFFVENQDPRVRSIFTKNSFDAHIVDGFLKDGKKLPSYIDKYVNKTTDGKGFAGWKAPGEPWVRYHGRPIDVKATEDATFNQDYYKNDNFKLTVKDKEGATITKEYNPTSAMQERFLRNKIAYNFPALPGETPKKIDINRTLYTAYMTSAEVNLYLAEFQMLGAGLPNSKTAEAYYNAGVEQSVRLYDYLAQVNVFPYYVETAGDYDATIELKSGEVEALMNRPAYKFVGTDAEKLEKIYLQQYFHFSVSPTDMYVTFRRTGIPAFNSTIYPFQKWDSKTGSELLLPRRYYIPTTADSDMMKEIKDKAYAEQGFNTTSQTGTLLNAERVWYDKGAPQFGAGPNYK